MAPSHDSLGRGLAAAGVLLSGCAVLCAGLAHNIHPHATWCMDGEPSATPLPFTLPAAVITLLLQCGVAVMLLLLARGRGSGLWLAVTRLVCWAVGLGAFVSLVGFAGDLAKLNAINGRLGCALWGLNPPRGVRPLALYPAALCFMAGHVLVVVGSWAWVGVAMARRKQQVSMRELMMACFSAVEATLAEPRLTALVKVKRRAEPYSREVAVKHARNEHGDALPAVRAAIAASYGLKPSAVSALRVERGDEEDGTATVLHWRDVHDMPLGMLVTFEVTEHADESEEAGLLTAPAPAAATGNRGNGSNKSNNGPTLAQQLRIATWVTWLWLGVCVAAVVLLFVARFPGSKYSLYCDTDGDRATPSVAAVVASSDATLVLGLLGTLAQVVVVRAAQGLRALPGSAGGAFPLHVCLALLPVALGFGLAASVAACSDVAALHFVEGPATNCKRYHRTESGFIDTHSPRGLLDSVATMVMVTWLLLFGAYAWLRHFAKHTHASGTTPSLLAVMRALAQRRRAPLVLHVREEGAERADELCVASDTRRAVVSAVSAHYQCAAGDVLHLLRAGHVELVSDADVQRLQSGSEVTVVLAPRTNVHVEREV